MFELIIFLFFLNLIIIFHELGHFLLAKKFKIPVLEFSVGFPPRIFSFVKNETRYSLGLTLLGGFVKLEGEEDPNNPKGFLGQKPLKRFLVIIGGVLMNLILAYLFFSLSYLIAFPKPTTQVFVSGFTKDSVVKNIFQKNDIILEIKIDDKKFLIQSPEEFVKTLKENLGKDAVFLIKRNDQILEINLKIPEKQLSSGGILGIYLSNFEFIKKPIPLNFYYAFIDLFASLKKIFIGFKYLIFKLFGQADIPVEIVGPIGIFSYFINIREFGWGYTFYFVGLLSLYLFLFNLLPIPALDGGRLIFTILEIVFPQRKINYKIESFIHQIGFVFLLALLFFITIKDVLKLIR